MEAFASLGAGLVAFLGAAGVLWGMSNSTRKENKDDIVKLGDATDRKIAEVAQVIATLGEATDRKIAANAEAIVALREITAKNSADIATLRESNAEFRQEMREFREEMRANTQSIIQALARP